jgi:hypothetical protein
LLQGLEELDELASNDWINGRRHGRRCFLPHGKMQELVWTRGAIHDLPPDDGGGLLC